MSFQKFKILIKEDSPSDSATHEFFTKEECYPDINLKLGANKDLSMLEIRNSLRDLGCNFENKSLSFYDSKRKLYVFCGKNSNLFDYKIPIENLESNTIPISCKELSKPLIDEIFSKKDLGSNSKEILKEGGRSKKIKKERTISEVVQKVALWRKLYNGFYDQSTSQMVNQSLEDGANRIGISKKTLDDYLSQIRLGKKYGFNFNAEKDGKIGNLRAFVKKNKTKGQENNVKCENENF